MTNFHLQPISFKRVFFGIVVFLLTCIYSEIIWAQGGKRLTSNEWVTLSKVTYKTTKDAYGDISVPVFSAETKALAGKTVTLPGYIIPLDGIEGAFKADHFVLSSLPVEACFFCGIGGPESVAEIQMKNPIEYTKKPIRLKGKLTLNETDSYRMIYILEDAEFVEVSQ